MLKQFILLNVVFLHIVASGQSNSDSSDNSIVYYNQDKQYYFLDLSETNQTIYFDSLIYDNNRPITILIKNNTSDSVTISYKSLISSKVIFEKNSTRYVKPNEFYSLSPIFSQSLYTQTSLLNAHFAFSYSTNKETKQFIFRLKGNIILDSLAGFEEQRNLEFPIAKSNLPVVLDSSDQEVLEKDNVFKYRNELWIYPKTADNVLPANLTLKYFINDSSYYAKKRLDSLNQVYFKIPIALRDSVYCVLTSPEYGFIFKKTIVREQVNEVTISFKVGAKLNEPHYYDGVGNRVAVKNSFIGCYYIPRDYKIIDFSQKRLDSLNTLVKGFDAILKYGMNGGFIVKCKPEFAIEIKKKLGSPDFHQIIEENVWINDLYKLDFALPLSKENITALLDKYGITDFYVNSSLDSGNNLDKNMIRNVTFRMENLPGNIKNRKIISELLANKEVRRVRQDQIEFFGHAND